MARILVIEDEPAIAESVVYSLAKGGHESRVATSLRAARIALEDEFDLIVLDLMLPDGSGFDLILELAVQRSAGLAVIVLSSRDAEEDRVRALEMGADDYVTKPFSPKEVVARVTAVLRRLHLAHHIGEDLAKPKLEVSHEKRKISTNGQPLELTRVEFDLLALLHSDPGHVFSRSVIIDRVWGEGFALSDRTIDSHVKALRKKLGDCGGKGEWIETVRGVGYRFSEEGAPS